MILARVAALASSGFAGTTRLSNPKESAQAPQRDPQLVHRFRVAALTQRRDIRREVIETVAKDALDGAVERIHLATGPSAPT